MNISNYCDGSCNMYHIAFLHEEFFCFGAYCFDYRIRQEFFLVKPLDTFVQVYAGYRTELFLESFTVECYCTYLGGRAYFNCDGCG